jgi:hypothetical protein
MLHCRFFIKRSDAQLHELHTVTSLSVTVIHKTLNFVPVYMRWRWFSSISSPLPRFLIPYSLHSPVVYPFAKPYRIISLDWLPRLAPCGTESAISHSSTRQWRASTGLSRGRFKKNQGDGPTVCRGFEHHTLENNVLIHHRQLLTNSTLKLRIVFWDVLPCKIIVDRRFRCTCCLHQKTNLNFILAAVRTWNLTDSTFSIVAFCL